MIKTPIKKFTPTKKFANAISIVGSTFKTMFNEALDARDVPALHFGRQKWVAERYGVSPSAARKWVSGTGLPDLDHMLLISDDLGLTLDALLGRKPSRKNTQPLSIPMLSNHSLFGAPGSIDAASLFEEGILETSMRMKQNGIEMHVISSDSMTPTINIGDITLVDTKVKLLQGDHLYLFSANNRFVICRAVINPDNSVKLLASKANYPAAFFTLPSADTSKEDNNRVGSILKLIGEISWVIRKMFSHAAIGDTSKPTKDPMPPE